MKEKKRSPGPGRPFVKGQSGNPGGRSKLEPEIKAFKETTYKDFINNLQKYGAFSPNEMEEEIKRPTITMFEKIFGTIVIQASQGEKSAREVLLDRLWGKVKEHKEVDVDIRSLNPKDMIEAGKAALKVLEGEVDALQDS